MGLKDFSHIGFKNTENTFMARFTLKNIFRLLFPLFAFLFFSPAFGQNKKFVVVLDAGHGGDDGGATGFGGYREKDITLQITQMVGGMIAKNHKDVQIIYTRSSDVFIPLHERAAIANRNKADLFISIHCNANKKTDPFGTESYVMGLHRVEDNMDIAKRENSVIYLEDNYKEVYQNFDPNSIEDLIGLTLYTNKHLDNSIRFAELVENQFKSNASRFSRGVKQAGFLVIRETTMPSVLIETGFITNPEEGMFLSQLYGQEKIAESIYNAFATYKKEVQQVAQVEEEKPVIDKPKVDTNSGSGNYKVQFLSSKTKFPNTSPQMRGLKNQPIEVVQTGGLYKYYYGSASTPQQATELLNKVKKSGFSDAFIVENKAAQATAKGPFTIEIMASKQKYESTDKTFKGYIVRRVKKDGIYSYQFGKFTSYADAQKTLEELKSKGFKNAMIIGN
ncbi:MAG: N-acetylmuramoyl-L-alanine amidase [Flavobacteriaceae bacterium]|nr:MAG: N-acetylmuramoyl-L-alanine amidase [Flavobacteriaceae bacterium]